MDWPCVDVVHDVWQFIRQIPTGCVATYGDVARALGDIAASRFVGELMMDHLHTDDCCCHRLVRADGSVGKYVSGDSNEKLDRLKNEGVDNRAGKIDLSSHGWKSFQGSSSLQRLAGFQQTVADRVQLDSSPVAISSVGGVDVSFVPGGTASSSRAVATFVELDAETWEVTFERTISSEIAFPYISGYLAFRELPILKQLVEQVRDQRNLPDVIVVDGSGILHPRRTGVATMLGVVANVATIGVTKKHLIGDVCLDSLNTSSCPIEVDGETLGYAMLPGSGTAKPVYTSPGHAISVSAARELMRSSLRGRRLPEPIYWADRISRRAARERGSRGRES